MGAGDCGVGVCGACAGRGASEGVEMRVGDWGGAGAGNGDCFRAGAAGVRKWEGEGEEQAVRGGSRACGDGGGGGEGGGGRPEAAGVAERGRWSAGAGLIRGVAGG
ncbi:hypothetical protein GCM10010512_19650 [Streptomyces thermoviolaceus subsp. thermoviolaceus]|nr:hypothetical protein GCM10010499_25340 [Streptomyces thermoviolaceus subsp. apingens]GHA88296.1 hypothetical protein GCM10010512_19650 [Streptomyces thermoviolaceus subsp. thermoviolaceus]